MNTPKAEELRAIVRGSVLCPTDEGYDAGRRIFNGMIDMRPALILRAAGAADVIAGIGFAHEHGLILSVRGGGHGIAGKALCEGGLTLDLSRMKGIRVEPARRT